MNRKRIKIVVSIMIILLCWGYGIYLERYAVDNFTMVSVRLEGEGVSQSKLEEALLEAQNNQKEQESTPSQVVAWNRSARIEIENTKLNTTTKTRVIWVMGAMAKVCPMKLLYGNFCYEKDTQGCVIDEKTAYDLFRNKDVVGNSITYQSKEYTIRGVVKAKDRMVLIPNANKDMTYVNLEFLFPNVEKQKELAKDFIQYNGLSLAYKTIIEGSFYARLLHNSVRLPAIIIVIYALIFLAKQAYKCQRSLLLCAFFIGLFVMTAFIFLSSSQLSVYYPNRWIPTKWSDFAFWGRIIEEWKQQFYDSSYLLPLPKDKILKHTIMLCNVMSLIASIQTIRLIQCFNGKRRRLSLF